MQIDHPILARIRELQEDERTGILRLERENQSVTLSFQQGLIAAAGATLYSLQLGRVLFRRGILQNAAIPKLLEFARRKRHLLGEIAVLRNLLDDVELKDAVREQAVQAVAHAIERNFEVGSFQDAAVDLYVPAQLDFERLFLELARSSLKPIRLDPNRLLTLNNGRSLSHLPWYPQELSVLSLLETPCTLKDMAIATGMEYQRLSKILCVFDSLRILREVDAPPSESTALVKHDGFPFMHLTPEIGGSGLSAKLETFHNPSSFISEQFKNLKVRLAEAAAQAPLKVIAVSSPRTEDGKSLVSVNLALSFAKDPARKVVLVDCDLRNPSLQRFLGISLEPGLLGYLESDYLQAYCYMRRLDKLFFMTSGGAAPNPVESLSSPRMAELIAYLKTEFDTVILDCPPFGPISDAPVLTGLADGLLLVLRHGKTTYATMEKAFQNFDRSKLVGIVFNDVKPMMFNTQYPYRYYRYRSRSYYPYGSVRSQRHQKTYLE